MIGAWLAAAALAAEVQRYAVVVGTNEGLRDDEALEYAELDAVRVAEVLEDLGGVRSEDVVALRRVDADRVRAAIVDLGERIARHRGESEALLFFYYSGHADADALHLQGTRLGLVELTELLAEVPVDVRILVVDACQSGELTRLKGAGPAEPFTIRATDRLDSEGMAIITSSSVGEDAQESDRLRGGMFTHHFVAGLMGAADTSGDQQITLTEAYRYGRTETIRATSRARFVQHPSYAFALRGRSDLVLTRTADPGRNGVLALTEAGSWLVFSGRGGDLVTEVTVDRHAELLLPPGEYLVRRRSDRGVWERSLIVDRGGTVALRSSEMSPVSYGATVRKGLQQAHAAWALTAGAGVMGPTAPGWGVGPLARLGAIVDLEALTVEVRAVGSAHATANDQLAMRQGRAGLDGAAIRKLDVGAFAAGIGMRAGGDVTVQWFVTEGTAPRRRVGSGRLGPVLALDVPLGSPRSLAILEAGADIQLAGLYDPAQGRSRLTTTVIPTLALEFARYAR